MKLKDKIKSYSFWVSLASAVILILKLLGNRFNFVVDETMISDLFTALCSILVLLGIIVVPTNTKQNDETKESIINHKLNNNTNHNKTEIDSAKENCSNTLTQKTSIENNSIQNNFLSENLTNDNLTNSKESEIEEDVSLKKSEDIISNTERTENSSQEDKVEDLESSQNQAEVDLSDNIKTEDNIVTLDNENISEETTNNTKLSNSTDLKSILNSEREKFTGNLDEYIFELQEAIRKTREGV